MVEVVLAVDAVIIIVRATVAAIAAVAVELSAKLRVSILKFHMNF